MNNYLEIEEYKFENFHQSKMVFLFLSISIISTIFCIFLLIIAKQNQFITGVVTKKEENVIEIIVPQEMLEKVLQKNKIIIERKTFTYNILGITENKIKEDVTLELELKDKMMENNISIYKIEIDTKNLGNIFWNYWKGEY